MAIESFQDVERELKGLSGEIIRTREDMVGMRVALVRRLDEEVGDRLVALDDPDHGKVVILGRRIDANRRAQGNLHCGLIGVGVVVVVLAILGLFLRQGTKERMAAAAADTAMAHQEIGKAVARVTRVERRMDSAEDHLASLERRVIGVRRLVKKNTGRIGAVSDKVGVDQNERLILIPGFESCRLDASGTLIAPTLTSEIKELIKEAAELVKAGEKPTLAAGFADETPFRKNGVVLPNSDELNSSCANARGRLIAEHLQAEAILDSPIPNTGRGITTKFGGLDVNRSVLIYLERAASS